uniref:LTD domain-containing protein n=1 Tax=Fibrocapsa japonica TaxID=94617 RepID=A0A7S2V5E9_9STRA|mmetsp:Transcript_3509/g.5197  ORF Transcript_3509/g.5197 Transcript_3509/m.5197 type:complete len:377 (+) Transcript_3509:2-1132(+)
MNMRPRTCIAVTAFIIFVSSCYCEQVEENDSKRTVSQHPMPNVETRHYELGNKRNELFEELVGIAEKQAADILELEKEKAEYQTSLERCRAAGEECQNEINLNTASCQAKLDILTSKNTALAEMERQLSAAESNHKELASKFKECKNDLATAQARLQDLPKFVDPLETLLGVPSPPFVDIIAQTIPTRSVDGSEVVVGLGEAGALASVTAIVGVVLTAMLSVLVAFLSPTKIVPRCTVQEGVALRMVPVSQAQTVRLTNESHADLDLSGCTLQITHGSDDTNDSDAASEKARHSMGPTTFEFQEGYLLTKGTSAVIHAGKSAEGCRRPACSDGELFDSRTCPSLFWTTEEVIEEGASVQLVNSKEKLIKTVAVRPF